MPYTSSSASTELPANGLGPRSPLASWIIPVLLLAFHLITHAGYGYFRDELYYLANARHLGFGYVDHPPLVGLVAAAVAGLLGTSLFALRLLPAVAHAATVSLVAATAREMGGGRTAQLFAALAGAVAPVLLSLCGYFSMNAFDVLCWAALYWIVARYLRTGNERLWLAFGFVAGVGLENKISVLFLGFGVACGLVVAGPRGAFRRPWLWAGGVVAGLLFLPHLMWQAANGWPTLEFVQNATANKNVSLSPAAFLGALAVQTMPTVPVWTAGLVYLLAGRGARRFRAIGWAFLAVLAVMLATNAKPYYVAPAFAGLFAAGGVGLEGLGSGVAARWLHGTVLGFLLITAVVIAPFAKPLLPVETFVAYQTRLGLQPAQEERHRLGRLPQMFADMHGWEELAAAIGAVHAGLPASDQARACVFVQNYGEAGAVDVFGPRHGLPPALSGHNSYFLWGPRDCSGEVLIVLGGSEKRLHDFFSRVERAAMFSCFDCMPYENDQAIWVVRDIKRPVTEIWPGLKHYD